MLPLVILPRFLLLFIELLQAVNSPLSIQHDPKLSFPPRFGDTVAGQGSFTVSIVTASAARYLWIQLTAKCSAAGGAALNLHHKLPYKSVRCLFPGYKSKGSEPSSMSRFLHGGWLPGDCVPLLSNHKHTVSCCQRASYTGYPFHQVVQCDEGTVRQNPQFAGGGVAYFCALTKTKTSKKTSQGSVFHLVPFFVPLELLMPTRFNSKKASGLGAGAGSGPRAQGKTEKEDAGLSASFVRTEFQTQSHDRNGRIFPERFRAEGTRCPVEGSPDLHTAQRQRSARLHVRSNHRDVRGSKTARGQGVSG